MLNNSEQIHYCTGISTVVFDFKKGESEFEMVWISWKWILGLVSYFQLSARRDINGDITMYIYRGYIYNIL